MRFGSVERGAVITATVHPPSHETVGGLGVRTPTGMSTASSTQTLTTGGTGWLKMANS